VQTHHHVCHLPASTALYHHHHHTRLKCYTSHQPPSSQAIIKVPKTLKMVLHQKGMWVFSPTMEFSPFPPFSFLFTKTTKTCGFFPATMEFSPFFLFLFEVSKVLNQKAPGFLPFYGAFPPFFFPLFTFTFTSISLESLQCRQQID
jgi:hypothetical protein